MKSNSIKRFKLNKAALKDFDKLMSMNLAEVEELIVTEIDQGFKILNIISLCLNIRTLVIEGNQRLDTSAVLNHVCKPDLLECIILRNVKLPNERAMSKFKNIKIISLSDIRYSKISEFFDSIVNFKKIEGLSLIGVDFGGESFNIISRFLNIKMLNLKKLKNCRFDNLEFLRELPSLKKIVLKDSVIKAEELNGLIKGRYEKDILLEIENDVDSKVKDYLVINEEEGISVKVNTASLDTIVNKVSFYKLDKLILILDKINNIDDYIKKLKKIKNRIVLEVKDFSYISVKDAKEFQTRLKVEAINIIDEEGFLEYKKKKVKYSIEEYIEIKQVIDSFVQKAEVYDTDLEKFLCAYREIGMYLDKDYNVDFAESDITNLNNMLKERKTFREGYAEVLQNVLACLKIPSIFVKGTVDGEAHLWNQVFIDGVWYNVDLEKDKETLSKKGIFRGRVEYCLVSDEFISKTHTANAKDKNFAPISFDVKQIRNFIRKVKNIDASSLNKTTQEEIKVEKVQEEKVEKIEEVKLPEVTTNINENIVEAIEAPVEEIAVAQEKEEKIVEKTLADKVFEGLDDIDKFDEETEMIFSDNNSKKESSKKEKGLAHSLLVLIEKIKNICMHNRVKTLKEGSLKEDNTNEK